MNVVQSIEPLSVLLGFANLDHSVIVAIRLHNVNTDRLAGSKKINLPIFEVKYQQGATLVDCVTMRKLGFKKGILVSRDTLATREGFVVIPVEMFLMS